MPPRLLLLSLCLYGAATSTQAAICRVAPLAQGTADGTSWANVMTLQSALDSASCSEIWLRQGIYRTGPTRSDFFKISRPVHLYGGFLGGETAREQRATNSRLTVLSGDFGGDDTATVGIVERVSDIANASANNSYNVLRLQPGSSTLALTRTNTVMDGLTITGGYADGNDDDSRGGGLNCKAWGLNQVCSPRIHKVTFSGNYAQLWGGGMLAIANYAGTSNAEITHSTFSGNSAAYGGALGVLITSNNQAVGSVTVAASTFSDNTAQSA